MFHDIPLKRKIIVMAAVMSAVFLTALDQTIVTTALGRIVEEFHSFGSLSWVVTAYLLTMTITLPLAGKLSDLFGRKNLLLIGVGLFTITSLLSGTSHNITELIIWRAVQGIGSGIITANAFAIVGDLFSPRERGRWQGLISGVFALASVIGPLLGGFLTDTHTILGLTTSWRWTFWINVPIGIAAFVLIIVFCPLIKHAKRHVIDWLGAAFLTLALGCLVLAVDNTDKIFASIIDSGFSLASIRLILYSVVALSIVGFIFVEKRAKSPIIPLGFFKNRTFTTVMITGMLYGAAFMGAILYVTQFNQQVFGASAVDSGLMLLPAVLSMSITSALTGMLVTKTGKYKFQAVFGMALTAAGMFLAAFMQADSPYYIEAIIMIIFGLGSGQVMPIINLAVQNEFPQAQLGVATSSTQLFRSLGQTLGTAILGGMLTAGVAAGLGDIASNEYIQALASSPQSSQVMGGQKLDADLAMQLNQKDMKEKITGGFAGATAGLPEPQKQAASNQFNQIQSEFSTDVTNSFVDSLHKIFFVTAGMMVVATIITAVFLPQRRLREHGVDPDPGVADETETK